MPVVPASACVAASARCSDCNHDSIAFCESAHSSTASRDRSHPFVTADRPLVRLATSESMDVRSADSAQRYVDDDSLLGRNRIGNFHEFDLLSSGDDSCKHGRRLESLNQQEPRAIRTPTNRVRLLEDPGESDRRCDDGSSAYVPPDTRRSSRCASRGQPSS